VEHTIEGTVPGGWAKPAQGISTGVSPLRPSDARTCPYARVIVAAAVVLIGLVACASPKPAPPEVNLSGFPPAFRDGYIDGCQSAKNGAAVKRDAARYANDHQYALGWRDGFDICRKRRDS